VARELKLRGQHTYSEFPPVLIYHLDDLRNTNVDGGTLYTRLVLRVEYLQNIFFAERLLIQHGHDGHADLLAVSLEMVSLTLLFWTHMDRLVGLHGDYEWLVRVPMRKTSTL
jgi:hypothetical protein